MDKSVVLQAINGYLAVTAIFGAVIFWRYIYYNRHIGYKELRPAIAILVMFLGEVVLRLPQFFARTIVNAGVHIDQPSITLMLGGAVVEVAFLCIVRVFSPEKWGYWSWLTTFLTSSLVVAISLMFVS
jgi:uncharacterized membrane-anchored protein